MTKHDFINRNKVALDLVKDTLGYRWNTEDLSGGFWGVWFASADGYHVLVTDEPGGWYIGAYDPATDDEIEVLVAYTYPALVAAVGTMMEMCREVVQ